MTGDVVARCIAAAVDGGDDDGDADAVAAATAGMASALAAAVSPDAVTTESPDAIDAHDRGHVLPGASCVRADGRRVSWELHVDNNTAARAATQPRDDNTTGAGDGCVAKRTRLAAACSGVTTFGR